MPLTLTATTRDAVKERTARLRRAGGIPAVVYGPGFAATSIAVQAREFKTTFAKAGETQIIELTVGQASWPVLVHDFQRDPMTGAVSHIDFLKIVMDRVLTASVPLQFVGVAPAVKDLGGVLITNLREVEVKALPDHIPAHISVDVTGLKAYRQEILARDLVLPAGVTLVTNPGSSIIAVLPPRTQAELEALSEKVEEKVADVASAKPEKTAEGEAAPAEGDKASATKEGAKEGVKAKAAAPPAAKTKK